MKAVLVGQSMSVQRNSHLIVETPVVVVALTDRFGRVMEYTRREIGEFEQKANPKFRKISRTAAVKLVEKLVAAGYQMSEEA